MKDIVVKDYITGDVAVSYMDGMKCREEINHVLEKEDKVFLDFKGINYVITAFLNPIIGDLIFEQGKDIMKKIEIKNANKEIEKKIRFIREGALLNREDLIE
ncbi:MAG: STAS-like domain-containing protein [Muricoprocola sp.]